MKIIIDHENGSNASVYDNVVCYGLWQKDDIKNVIQTMCEPVPSDEYLDELVSDISEDIWDWDAFPSADNIAERAQELIDTGDYNHE